jgi:nucleoid-associated protein YgaU
MTSDAKIGLLLGLVFIFVIAFVINGLPRFRNTTNGSELTTNMVSSYNDPLGIGDKEREVQSLIDWPAPEAQAPQPEPQTPQPASESEENVRFRIKLPEKISHSPIVEATEEAQPAQPVVVERVKPDPADVVAQNTVEVLKQTPDLVSHTPAPQPAAEPKIEIKRPKPPRPVSPKVYTVTDGDNLAKIAKKFYGAEEGNKRTNIMRIFEANRGVLASPDEVGVGQHLLIPPTVTSRTVVSDNSATKTEDSADQNKTKGTLASVLFEKAESIGRKVLQADDTPKEKPKPAPSRQYVVQDGDYLWKIAARELGNGSRYKEIAKLNADVLDDETKLPIGTTLKLPAR